MELGLKEKIVIVNRCSEKIYEIIENVLEKNISDTKIILNANILEKKSKLRNLFEKEKKLVCIPFYEDNLQTLRSIAINFFKLNKSNYSKNLLEKKVTEIMTKNPKTLSPDTLVDEAIKLMNKQSITNYFITKKKKPIGIIHLHDIL